MEITKMNKLIKEAKEAKEIYPNEELEVNWLETTNEYVLNCGNYIVVDGLKEKEAEQILDLLVGELENNSNN